MVDSLQRSSSANLAPRKGDLSIDLNDRESIIGFVSSCLFRETDPQKVLQSVINAACHNRDFEALHKVLSKKYDGLTHTRPTPTELFFSADLHCPQKTELILRALGTKLSNSVLKNYYCDIKDESKTDALANLFTNVRTFYDRLQPLNRRKFASTKPSIPKRLHSKPNPSRRGGFDSSVPLGDRIYR